MIRQEITEREYWQRRSDEVGASAGPGLADPGVHARALAGDAIIRPAAAALVAAGHRIGVMTNDLRAFHGDTAMASHPVLTQVDVLVDASVTGILKPDPRAYALAAEELGTTPGEIVFVDDLPWNVTGARQAGMIALELDLRDPAAVFAQARAELGLDAEAA